MFIICENEYIVNCALNVELCYVVVDLWWNSCLLDVIVVMRYCCWWFITWVFKIMDLWCDLSCCWWFLWKWVDLVNYVEMAFVFMFNAFLKALLSSWTCKQSLETYLGVGRSKFGFWSEKWFKPVKNSAELMTIHLRETEASCNRTATGRILLARDMLRLSEMLSDSFPCFAFLSLFHTFLFWISLWCKHESFR
jgi:hypothetical protein